MQQQHQFDERTRLLNISYCKLQKIKINKITKKAIETPLNQSVIVWNFIKKVKNSIFETQHQHQNKENTIGSERKIKLLNNYNENEPQLIEQDQLNILLKHSKLSYDDLIVSNDGDNDIIMTEDFMMDDFMMEDLTDFTFSLSTLSSSEQNQENNHNYQKLSNPSESSGQPLDFNIEYFDDNIIDQFEQVISMLLDSE